MRTTIYATFNDPKHAEMAAGVLLDRGIATTDLSVIQSHTWGRFSEIRSSTVSEMLAVVSGSGSGAIRELAIIFVPDFGLVLGKGELAIAVSVVKDAAPTGAADCAMTSYLKDQRVENLYIAHYKDAIRGGGAVLGVTLPSGTVDEGVAWTVLDKFSGMNASSYASRPYIS